MGDLWKTFRRSRSGLTGLGLVLLLILLAALAPLLTARTPLATSSNPLLPPGGAALLGTDNIGRDVWSGIVYGARVSLAVGVLVAVAAAVFGTVVGAIAGFAGGVWDTVLMRVSEFFQIIPQFFLALVFVAIVGRGLDKVILVLSILGWPLTARLMRAQFLSLRRRDFVEAARAAGMSDLRIAVREILPNALPPVVVTTTLGAAHAILLEAGVSFFGLGNPTLISWGQMLNNAQGFLQQAWWMSVFPGLSIFLAVLGFNLLGDGLNDALSPRLRSRG